MSSRKAIDGKIKTISTSAAKLNGLIHETGMLILAHAQAHGDASRAQHLVMAMPASMRRTMLIAWFSKYSPIVTKPSTDWASKMHKPDSKLYVPFDLDGAAAEPFYVIAEKTAEEKPFDLAAMVRFVAGLQKQIDKRIDDGKVPAEDIETAKALSVKLGGLKVDPVKPANDDMTGVKASIEAVAA